MNSKKFIALLSASALAASSFASLATIAFADDEVLWSDTFDKYENSVDHMNESVGKVFLDGTYNPNQTSSDIAGLTLTTDGKADDSSYFKIAEKEAGGSDKYLQTSTSRFSSVSRGSSISFTNAYSAEAGKDVVFAFDVKLEDAGDTGYDHIFTIGNIVIDMAGNNLDDGNWHKLKLVAKNGVGTFVFADDKTAEGEEIASDTATSFTGLRFDAYIDGAPTTDGTTQTKKATNHPFGYPTYGFDNFVVYTSADGIASTVPAAEINTSTPAPTATPAPPAAEIDTESDLIDFDNTDFDGTGVTVASHKEYATTTTTEDAGDNGSIVYSVAQTSSKNNSYSYATIDFSSIAAGKSHVILDYDINVGSDGRLSVIFNDGIFPSGNADTLPSFFKQGVTKGGDTGTNCRANEWVHTNVDVDLASGSGTYTVTKLDGSPVSSGKFTTELQAFTAFSLVSWSPNTSYLDNIKVQAGGSMAVADITPEPASEEEGSFIELKPSGDDVRDFGGDYSAVLGTATKVLNHSEAKPAVAGEFSTYSDKVKGKSIFVAYDAYVGKGDKLTFAGYGDSGKALGPQFVIEGMADGTAVVSGIGDKGEVVTAKDKVLAETWYRVVLEIPQTSDGTTGTSTYTVYRIDLADPSKTTETAASVSVTPRNLSGRGMTSMQVSATGTPYIDNLAAYFMSAGSGEGGTTATPEPASEVEGSGLDLTENVNARATFDAAAIEGTPAKVLNHSEAKPAAAGSIDTYYDKARGNSIYAAFDFYVKAGDKLTFAAYGDSGKALGPQFVITGGDNGSATVATIVNSSGEVSKGTVANETWYRAVIEIPQGGTSEAGTTGDSTFKVYRINAENPQEVTDTLINATGISARNLSNRGMTSIQVSVAGTPYIDNTAVYVADKTQSAADTWTKYEAEYSGGRLTKVTSTPVEDPSTVETDIDNASLKVMVWNGNHEPYKAD